MKRPRQEETPRLTIEINGEGNVEVILKQGEELKVCRAQTQLIFEEWARKLPGSGG